MVHLERLKEMVSDQGKLPGLLPQYLIRAILAGASAVAVCSISLGGSGSCVVIFTEVL